MTEVYKMVKLVSLWLLELIEARRSTQLKSCDWPSGASHI